MNSCKAKGDGNYNHVQAAGLREPFRSGKATVSNQRQKGWETRAMSTMAEELIRLTAVQAVTRLKRGDITPLDLIDAAERRIAEVEPSLNALPTLCLER